MNGRLWTSTEDEVLHQSFRDNVPLETVGRQLNRSQAAVKRRRDKLGIVKYRRIKDQRFDLIVEYLKKGWTVRHVASELGVCPHGVKRVRDKVGIRKLSHHEVHALAGQLRQERCNKLVVTPVEGILLQMLSDGPLSTNELSDQYGYSSHNNIRNRLWRLRKKGKAFAEGRYGVNGVKWYAIGWWLLANDGLVRKTAAEFVSRAKNIEFEDLVGMVREEVIKCVPSFRPRGIKFSTYAIGVARRAMTYRLTRERLGGVHVPGYAVFDFSRTKRFVSIYDKPASCTLDTVTYASSIEDREHSPTLNIEPDSFWENVCSGLEEKYRNVILWHYRDGMTFMEIGRRMNYSRGRIEQWCREAEVEIYKSRAIHDYDVAG